VMGNLLDFRSAHHSNFALEALDAVVDPAERGEQ
jgi:hypothetical protein